MTTQSQKVSDKDMKKTKPAATDDGKKKGEKKERKEKKVEKKGRRGSNKNGKSREEVFGEALKKAGKKGITRDALIQDQMENYGGSENWAQYTVDLFLKILDHFGIFCAVFVLVLAGVSVYEWKVRKGEDIATIKKEVTK